MKKNTFFICTKKLIIVLIFFTQKKGAGGSNVANITATASYSKDTGKKDERVEMDQPFR